MGAQVRVAVVTGGGRGLGTEICRQLGRLKYRVLLTARDPVRAEACARDLAGEGHDVSACQLDVTGPDEIRALAEFVDGHYGRVDVLINNAGVFLEPRGCGRTHESSVFAATPELVLRSFQVNALGPLQMCQALVPLMRRNHYGRIVNVSSGMGQLCDMGGCFAGYRLSKSALNAVSRSVAAETAGDNILVNSVCPGWVRTEMGGPNAERSLEEGARGIVWAATLPDCGPTGGFFRDGQPLAW